MIEVKNLKKTYVTKGTTTHALDDVSIKFPEKGMVFLLGKSGSGKSTLLNSIGGLDTVDSGEIIIMGRSSSTFSGSDFDSYRNTFIGFIFQEYNILNEFSVEENIALALELQGKKSNKERVHKLLEEVDLKGFEKRKPNTLSGGQKQRIAIARALIKEPKIIMADEPTGALDSKTGKQVLDTLKKLSKEKLIIIVSHDREFAEIYGDRIIELKDGKIISDEEKTHIDPKNLNDNVSIIGENTLSIKDAKSLSAEDKGEILKFIEQANDKIIIATNNNDISSFKKANRISDDDKTETFTKTGDISLRSYDEKERKFIRSRLPITKATKMGLSSLKVKPFRLVITMLLTIISFTLFGVSSSLMNYNGKEVTKNSFNKSDYNSLKITNNYSYENKYYVNDKLDSTSTNDEQTYFTYEDINNLYTSYGNDTLALYALNNIHNSGPSISNIETLSTTPKTLQGNQIDGFATPKDGSKYDYYLHGVKPVNNDEIAISDFYAKLLINSKLKDVNNSEISISVNNEDDLLGKKLRFNFNWDTYKVDFKITGIYKSDDMSDKYNNYDNQEEVNKWSSKKIEEFKDYIEETPKKVFFITKEAYKALATYIKFNPKDYDNNYYRYFYPAKGIDISYNDSYNFSYYSYKKKSESTLPITYLNGYDANSEGIIIARNDFLNVINNTSSTIEFNYDSYDMNEISSKIKNFIYSAYERRLVVIYQTRTNEEIETFNNDYLDYYNFQKDLEYYNKINDMDKVNEIVSSDEYAVASEKFNEDSSKYYSFIDSMNYDTDYYANNGLSDFYKDIYNHTFSLNSIYSISSYDGYNDDIAEAYDIYMNYVLDADLGYASISIKEYDSSMTITRKIIGYYEKENKDDGNHAYGIYIDDNDQEIFRSKYYTSQESKFELKDSDAYYNYAYVPTNNSIFNDLEAVKDNDSFISARNSLYSKINQITELIGMLKDIFFYLGLALAIFSALLLFNFITVSISSKTHEIGVLRAVGARGKDVFKIFFAESLFIALLSFLIALAAAIAIVIILNANLSKQLSFELVLLSFGPLSVALMLGIALAVALVGTFIPVLHISRKKPVDSLRSQ